MRLKAIAVVLLLFSLLTPLYCAVDNRGREFWLAMPPGFIPGSVTKQLLITSAVNTTVNIVIPEIFYNQNFSVIAGAITTVNLWSDSDVRLNDAVTGLGIHVSAPDDVIVYGICTDETRSDGYLGIPVTSLGTNYIVSSYTNSALEYPMGTQFVVVGAYDGTTVTINPSVTCISAGATRTAGVAYTVVLNEGQTYLLQNNNGAGYDLTGTFIDSDKPVAVFGSHVCANVPVDRLWCDFLVEQLAPSTSWGKDFIIIPSAGRTGGDIYRVTAAEDNTNVYLDGANLVSLNRGYYGEVIISGAGNLTADKRVQLMQYANGTDYDGNTGDPFMMTVQPVEQYLSDYTIGEPAGFTDNYLNIAAPASAVGIAAVDGTPIAAGSWIAVGTSGYYATRVLVDAGTHYITSPDPVGVTVYGFGYRDAYGYPGGAGYIDFVSTPTPTITPTKTPTYTRTITPTRTGTRTMTPTKSPTPEGSLTITPTFTESPESTPANSRTNTLTPTFTRSETSTLTHTRTSIYTLTFTPTAANAHTFTVTKTPTFSRTASPTDSFTATVTVTMTSGTTSTVTPTATITPTPPAPPTFTQIPGPFRLDVKDAFPDPFKDETEIVYRISRDADVYIKVFTVSGETVVESGKIHAAAGYNHYRWNGMNRANNPVASGVFIYRVLARAQTGESAFEFRKLVCLR
ncbi:MAG: hypothetical protein LLG37_03435 [Spirochaetia bacterium]|nr:hypothetical protein [Spirochaetia bacterium]